MKRLMVTLEAPITKTMKASEFEANCLAVVEEVAATGETVVVTKNGEPVVELVPHKKSQTQSHRTIQ